MVKAAAIDYIMDDPREAARLEAKVDPDAWVQRYMAHHIRPGMEVLSVGCGPGVSADRIRAATERNRENPNVKFVCGDAHEMQFPTNSFDVVYSRMLLQYLQQKERSVAEMVRMCRPGGVVLLQDLDGQLLWHYPEDPALQHTVEKVVTALGTSGFDPFVGRKLFWLARKAGLENLNVQVDSYHLIAGEVAPDVRKQWELKLEIARPQTARILGSDSEAKEHSSRFLEYLSRPDTLTYSTVFTVTGEKPF